MPQLDPLEAVRVAPGVAHGALVALDRGPGARGPGGGRPAARARVDRHRAPLMPGGRCRQLLWEHGGPDLLVETVRGIKTMRDVLPDALGPEDLEERS